MRKIKAGMFISLDGVVEAPDQWHFPYFNEEMGEGVTEDMEGADTLLIGRVTYDSFAGAWPDREAGGGEDAPFATGVLSLVYAPADDVRDAGYNDVTQFIAEQ